MQVRQYLNRKNYYLNLKSNLDIAFGGRGEIKVNAVVRLNTIEKTIVLKKQYLDCLTLYASWAYIKS